jgi:Rrf2 family protein
MLSQTAEYALRAVLAIAADAKSQPLGARRLARKLGVPQNYLSKTLYQLTRAGILESSRGKLGGFRLARPADRICLLDIVGRFDDLSARQFCIMGRPVCSDQTACAAHERWKVVSERVAGFFRETTVADLVRTGQPAAGR